MTLAPEKLTNSLPHPARNRHLRPSAALLLSLLTLFLAPALRADSDYYRHVFFDNSAPTSSYFYSLGHVSAPSQLALENGRVPVDTTTFFTPPNALRLDWLSTPGGDWEATIHVVNFRNRIPTLLGDTLFLWLYSAEPLAAADLPLIWIAV